MNQIITHQTPNSHFTSSDVWTRRFANEGAIWGNEPSPPGKFLTRKILEHSSRIVEVGAGYGRDTNWFAENGHSVTAIDRATTALMAAQGDLHDKINDGSVTYITADFRKASLGAKSHDVFFSHRVLHLLGNNGVVEAFGKMAANTLKPEGTLLVTARSFNDFKDSQMQWVDKQNGVATYRTDVESLGDRQGQTLHFWNDRKLRALFEDNFENIKTREDEEIESVSNFNANGAPVMTSYISIYATKKYTPGS